MEPQRVSIYSEYPRERLDLRGRWLRDGFDAEIAASAPEDRSRVEAWARRLSPGIRLVELAPR